MEISVKYSGSSFILAALFLLILPVKWIVSMVLAALVHEFFHFFAVKLTGNNVFEMVITNHGAIMKTTPLSAGQEFLCALAGPAGSILLLMCYPLIPRVSLCAGVQGLFNLLPLYPLDGGRALRASMNRCFSCQVADSICAWIGYTVMIVIFCIGIYGTCFLRLGFGPLLISLLLLSRGLSEKFLANREN